MLIIFKIKYDIVGRQCKIILNVKLSEKHCIEADAG